MVVYRMPIADKQVKTETESGEVRSMHLLQIHIDRMNRVDRIWGSGKRNHSKDSTRSTRNQQKTETIYVFAGLYLVVI